MSPSSPPKRPPTSPRSLRRPNDADPAPTTWQIAPPMTAPTSDRHAHAPEWRDRPNTVEIPHARYMLHHSRRMERFGGFFTQWDFPEQIELPADRPILFAANHRSFLDLAAAMAIFGRLGLSCRMLIRADVFDKPVLGGWLHRIGAIPTSRAVRETAEATAIATLEAGQTVAMMPEGRLVPPQDRPTGVGEARPGVSRIALASGAAVVPVAIHDSDRVWPRGRPWPKLPLRGRPTVAIRVGAPVEFGTDHDENTQRLMTTIAAMLAEIDATRRS